MYNLKMTLFAHNKIYLIPEQKTVRASFNNNIKFCINYLLIIHKSYDQSTEVLHGSHIGWQDNDNYLH